MISTARMGCASLERDGAPHEPDEPLAAGVPLPPPLPAPLVPVLPGRGEVQPQQQAPHVCQGGGRVVRPAWGAGKQRQAVPCSTAAMPAR